MYTFCRLRLPSVVKDVIWNFAIVESVCSDLKINKLETSCSVWNDAKPYYLLVSIGPIVTMDILCCDGKEQNKKSEAKV